MVNVSSLRIRDIIEIIRVSELSKCVFETSGLNVTCDRLQKGQAKFKISIDIQTLPT
jgi:hypothetical protein